MVKRVTINKKSLQDCSKISWSRPNLSKAGGDFDVFLTLCFRRVGVSCPFCIALSVVCYSNVSFRRLITSVWEERAVFSAIHYSYFCSFWSKVGVWERLRYFIVALPGPPI